MADMCHNNDRIEVFNFHKCTNLVFLLRMLSLLESWSGIIAWLWLLRDATQNYFSDIFNKTNFHRTALLI